MSVKIRLQRKGRKKRPFYHIVIADARAPRDGRFIERIGTYNPMTKPATIELDRDRAYQWLLNGAQPTDTARAILRFKGVYYKKHLQRGVLKGSITQEEADARFQAWVDDKEAKITKRREQTARERQEELERISGKPVRRAEVVEDTDVESPVEEVAADVTEAAGDAVEVAEATVEQAADAVAEQADETAAQAETVVDKAIETADKVGDKIEETVESAIDTAVEVADKVEDKIEEIVEDAVDAVKDMISGDKKD